MYAGTYVNKILTFQSLNEHEVEKAQLFTAVLSSLNYSKIVCEMLSRFNVENLGKLVFP